MTFRLFLSTPHSWSDYIIEEIFTVLLGSNRGPNRDVHRRKPMVLSAYSPISE